MTSILFYLALSMIISLFIIKAIADVLSHCTTIGPDTRLRQYCLPHRNNDKQRNVNCRIIDISYNHVEINNKPVRSHASLCKATALPYHQHQCFCFQNQINFFWDTLIQTYFFLDNKKINNCRGDLTDISGKKKH